MAHLRALLRLSTRLPSSSLFTHSISFPRYQELTSYRNITFSFGDNPEQIEFRKRIKAAMNSEEDEHLKDILSKLYFYRKRLPLTKEGFINFVKVSLPQKHSMKRIKHGTAKSIYETLEKTTPAESLDDLAENNNVGTKTKRSEQDTFRQRIQSAMEAEEDIEHKKILSELYNYPKHIPLHENGFVCFVMKVLPERSEKIDKVDKKTAKELYEKLEKIASTDLSNDISINDHVDTKEKSPVQATFRRRIQAAMENEKDVERKKILSELYNYPMKIRRDKNGFIDFVLNVLPKKSRKINNVSRKTARALYDALEEMARVESSDNVSGHDSLVSKKDQRRRTDAEEEEDEELEWKVKDLESDNKRLKHEVEALRREKFNMTRTNNGSEAPTPKIEVPKIMDKNDTIDDRFSKHGQAVDVIFQNMKSIRKDYHDLKGKGTFLERENRRLQKQIKTLTDLQQMIHQDSFKTRQKDELDSLDTTAEEDIDEWEEKFRDIEFEYEKYQKDSEEKLKQAFELIRKLREENIKLYEKSLEENKDDVQPKNSKIEQRLDEIVQSEISQITEGLDEILGSLDLEAAIQDISDAKRGEQTSMEDSKKEAYGQELKDVEQQQTDGTKKDEKVQEESKQESQEKP